MDEYVTILYRAVINLSQSWLVGLFGRWNISQEPRAIAAYQVL